jgi:hypothetical protein
MGVAVVFFGCSHSPATLYPTAPEEGYAVLTWAAESGPPWAMIVSRQSGSDRNVDSIGSDGRPPAKSAFPCTTTIAYVSARVFAACTQIAYRLAGIP